MADNFCKGDCLKCSFQQQVYCSAQRTYAIMENQRAIIERLDTLEKRMDTFTQKEDIINPFLKDEAQSSDGAENRSEVTI